MYVARSPQCILDREYIICQLFVRSVHIITPLNGWVPVRNWNIIENDLYDITHWCNILFFSFLMQYSTSRAILRKLSSIHCHYISWTLSSSDVCFSCAFVTLAAYDFIKLVQSWYIVLRLIVFKINSNFHCTIGASRWKRWNWPSRSNGITGKLLDHHILLLNYHLTTDIVPHNGALSTTAAQGKPRKTDSDTSNTQI